MTIRTILQSKQLRSRKDALHHLIKRCNSTRLVHAYLRKHSDRNPFGFLEEVFLTCKALSNSLFGVPKHATVQKSFLAGMRNCMVLGICYFINRRIFMLENCVQFITKIHFCIRSHSKIAPRKQSSVESNEANNCKPCMSMSLMP